MKHRVLKIDPATHWGECAECGEHGAFKLVRKATRKDPDRMVWICTRRVRKARARKKSPKTILQEKTQKRFNKMIVNHYKKCVVSHLGGCSAGLQCHHLKRTSSRPNLRYTFDNCVCVCAKHHMFFHSNPDVEYLEIEKIFPGRWDHLNVLARTVTKVNPEEVLASLKDMEAAA